LKLLRDVCCEERNINLITLEHVLLLAVEIAREGREGRRVGTLLVVSDSDEVLKRSRNIILDPLKGHSEELKRIDDPNMRETVKELTQLDGAFVISDDGVVVSACLYINTASQNIDLPLGFGSRHMAAASITKETNAVAIVVSESSIVRVFDDGELVSEIIPELWMISKYSHHLADPYAERREKELTVVSKTG
jgi:DNA integrity scanning protein DisA with diadenylate cyclase activity